MSPMTKLCPWDLASYGVDCAINYTNTPCNFHDGGIVVLDNLFNELPAILLESEISLSWE